MSHKISCLLCMYQANKRCIKKNSKINLNKPRNCSSYVESKDKLEMYLDKKMKYLYPKSDGMEKHVWDGKNIREWDGTRYNKVTDKDKINRLKAELGLAPSQSMIAPPSNFSGDIKHPLTGDLSRFSSTAEPEIVDDEILDPIDAAFDKLLVKDDD